MEMIQVEKVIVTVASQPVCTGYTWSLEPLTHLVRAPFPRVPGETVSVQQLSRLEFHRSQKVNASLHLLSMWEGGGGGGKRARGGG
jgi:hypothetical protein